MPKAPKLDFPRLARILRDGGYQGWVALEYEAKEDSSVAVPRALAEISLANPGVLQQGPGFALQGDQPAFHDIRARGQLQRGPCILLHQQHRHTAGVDVTDDIEDPFGE